MTEWLYQLIYREEPWRRPDFAQKSALNWMRALAFEITATHGTSFDSQWWSCEHRFRNVTARATIPHLEAVFEPLYASATFSTSLISLASDPQVGAWRCAGAIVEWYYAVYNACRSMLSACNIKAPDKHAKVAHDLNGQMRALLPHPLDMRATWLDGENYQVELPTVGGSVDRASGTSALAETFDGSSRHARDMLVSYLYGTADYMVEEIKRELLRSSDFKQRGLQNFRKKEAQQLRNARLRKREFNFLHLAFRYRGKANYRDAVFLAYGSHHLANGRDFVRDLATVARFTTICGLVYAHRRAGQLEFREFANDMKAHFRGFALFRNYA